jgi:DNA-binding transcriptional LysR family regulator
MTFHQLRILESVAKNLNITHASAKLHLSQPTVSQQLKLLEMEFGTKFLSRNSHGVGLTRQGGAFLEAVEPILRELDVVEMRFKPKQKARQTKNLLIGGTSSLVCLLPHLLSAFRTDHPEPNFVLETNDSWVLEERILESKLNIAVITNPSDSPSIVYEPFREHKVVAFAHPKYPLVGRSMKFADLADIPLIGRIGSSTINEIAKLGVPLNLAVQCTAGDAVKASVYKGMGVGILHWESVENEIATGMLKQIRVPELEKLRVRSYIIYHARKTITPLAQTFLGFLRTNQNISA